MVYRGSERLHTANNLVLGTRVLSSDAVVWTALPPHFEKVDRVPTVDEAVAYLRQLPHKQRRHAERYIRMAPRQVDTPYRRRFELELGWTPLNAP